MNELCSLLERDRERQNLLPCFFSFPNKLYPFGVLCQTELHQHPDPRAVALAAGMGRLFVTENENELLLDRERENPKPFGLGVKIINLVTPCIVLESFQ
jgi:hypothetical protein